jgi:hypothetical protein
MRTLHPAKFIRYLTSMASSMSNQATVYDVIGLGFGPSNLAIAGASLEKAHGVIHHLLSQVSSPALIMMTAVTYFH